MAISITNTILLFWLGATVLLNAERRGWGVWLAGGGLLLGGAFFVSHSAILGLGVHQLTLRNMVFWWTVGLVPTTTLPVAWYSVILWYAGYWSTPDSQLRRRHRIWYTLMLIMFAAGLLSLLTGVLLLLTPASRLVLLRLAIRWAILGVPVLAIGYAIYVLLCFGLSFDVLRQPAPSRHVMGSEARQRAHPWLVGTSGMLLLVSLMVSWAMLWLVQDSQQRTIFQIYLGSNELIARLDLAISLAIGIALLLLGQAVVSYEVFTGKSLPRRGLRRHWQRLVFGAAAYGVIIGGAYALQVRLIYSLLLTTILMTFFYALVSWRSYAERERFMANLRPFITSQRLYDQLLTTTVPDDVDLAHPFYVLCHDVLEAQVAYLAPVGAYASLIGKPIIYPEYTEATLPPLQPLVAQFDAPNRFSMAIDPAAYAGATWAISLWSQRGLIGLLLLGAKRNRGFYTHEEMEIARAVGERLIDAQASSAMSQRLMQLQRERLTQTQIIDQQTRRVLHDEILPTLQTALITLNATPGENGRVGEAAQIMADAHRQISDLLHDMPTTSVQDVARSGLLPALRRVVTNETAAEVDQVEWQIETAANEAVEQIPTLTAEVLYYAVREVVRNAVKYGRGEGRVEMDEKRPFKLTISVKHQNGIIIIVEDNGVGIQAHQPAQGTGHGLALHSTMMAVVGGELSIDTVQNQFTRVQLYLPGY